MMEAASEDRIEALYETAMNLVQDTGRISIVLLQTRLGVGYLTAERLMEMMEERGVFGKEMRSQWIKATGFKVMPLAEKVVAGDAE